MFTTIFIIAMLLIMLLLITNVSRTRNPQESKLSVFEHPSSFKKDAIEMVEGEKKDSDKAHDDTLTYNSDEKH